MSKEKTSLRQRIIFSKELKRHIVNQIENGTLTVREAKREYEVKGNDSIYRWLRKYSRSLEKGVVWVKEKSNEKKKR